MRRVIVIAQMLSESQANLRVLLQQLEELLVLYECNLARAQRLGCDLMGPARNRGAGAEHFTGFGNPCNQRLAIARTGGELSAPGANQIHSSRNLPFDEQNRSLGIDAV